MKIISITPNDVPFYYDVQNKTVEYERQYNTIIEYKGIKYDIILCCYYILIDSGDIFEDLHDSSGHVLSKFYDYLLDITFTLDFPEFIPIPYD